MLINGINVAEPSTPSSGRTLIYVDQNDKHLKTKDDTGTVRDITDTSLVLSTPDQIVQQKDGKGMSPLNFFSSPFVVSYSVKDKVEGLSEVVAPSGEYNLLSDMVTAAESIFSNPDKKPDFYKIDPVYNPNNNDGPVLTNWLDDLNNRFIFPSNKNTYGGGLESSKVSYIPYYFRGVITFDIPSTSATTTNFLVRARRYIDDSIVYTWRYSISDSNSFTDAEISLNAPTFVGSNTVQNGELDPYSLDGMYFDFRNETGSSQSITIKSIDIRIFRSFT